MASLLNQIFKPILERLPENNRLERIWVLAKVEFNKRYYESGLGLLWALINPLAKLLVYVIAFEFIRMSEFENFALYLFSGLLIWMFYTELAGKGLHIIRQKQYLLESIQFNWLDIFIATTLAGLGGFIFNFVAYIVMSFASGVFPTIHALWFPFLMLIIAVIAMGSSMILASINVFLKDINHIWPIIILGGFWTAPIFFPLEPIQAKAPFLVWIHPATSTIVNMRNILFYGQPMDLKFFFWSLFYAFAILGIGYLAFKKSSVYVNERL